MLQEMQSKNLDISLDNILVEWQTLDMKVSLRLGETVQKGPESGGGCR